MNWIDWLLIIFLLISIVSGLQQGMVRIGVGLIALFAGFFLASWFGGLVAGSLAPFVTSKATASILGYLLVFSGVLLLGVLVGALLARMLKVIGLSWMDRLLGAGFGLMRGFVVIAVVAMVITALSPKWLPKAVNDSRLAPYVLRASRVLTRLTPFDIRNGFDRAYKEFRKLELGKPDSGHVI